jgi:hypothetical protein
VALHHHFASAGGLAGVHAGGWDKWSGGCPSLLPRARITGGGALSLGVEARPGQRATSLLPPASIHPRAASTIPTHDMPGARRCSSAACVAAP